jgi:diadenosine tetraphosphate (Ap4A) HIT family hydrolase
MSDTIFSRIIRGEIPCHKVYEDEHVLAFLDIGPLSQGHTLVIPRRPSPPSTNCRTTPPRRSDACCPACAGR